MKLDRVLASPFRMDWLVDLDATTQDDYTRAVAERAASLLHGARFVEDQARGSDADVEVRTWVEAACGPACVTLTWEPGPQRFAFHLLDETLQERLAAIVFEDLPCLDGEESLRQTDALLDAILTALDENPGATLDEVAAEVRDDDAPVRVRVRGREE